MITLTYTGRRQKRGGGVLYTYRADNGNEPAFLKPLLRMTLIGGTVDVEIEGSQVRSIEAHWSVSASPEEVNDWNMQDRAATVADQTEKARKKLQREQANLGTLTLQELRDRSAKMLPDQQAALAAIVLRYVYG